MQIIHSILQISSNGTRITDENGSASGVELEIMLGTAVRLEFDLRGDYLPDGGTLSIYPADLLKEAACYFALDCSNSNSNAPALLKYSGISLESDSKGHNIMVIELADNGTDAVLKAISGRSSAVFCAEIGGFDSAGATVFAWQFELTIRSRVYIGGSGETVASDPAYYTAIQTAQLIDSKSDDILESLKNELRNPMEFEFSIDGISGWHQTQTPEDKFYRQRIAGINADWSSSMTVPGPPIKGIDYWTDEDKAEIQSYVENAILSGAW